MPALTIFKMQVESTPNVTGAKRVHTADSSTRVLKRPRKYFQGPTSAFNYYARDQRVAAKSHLELMISSERTPHLLRWWKEMPEDGRKPFVQLAHADKIRHATDTACLDVLQDVVADVCGENVCSVCRLLTGGRICTDPNCKYDNQTSLFRSKNALRNHRSQIHH